VAGVARSGLDAFDADVLIYAAIPGHPLGSRVAALFPVKAPGKSGPRGGVGSVLLLPEVLAKPLRDGDATAVRALGQLLTRLDLRPVDRAIAELATVLAARYGLRAADATHLATAISLGADRFITNNRRDFRESIEEIDVTYPDMLPRG
jgi:predicted nucleic acid-binding protein